MGGGQAEMSDKSSFLKITFYDLNFQVECFKSTAVLEILSLPSFISFFSFILGGGLFPECQWTVITD